MVDRAKHLDAVRGSFALEGLKFDEETETALERWAAGEITSEDLSIDVRQIVADARSHAQAS